MLNYSNVIENDKSYPGLQMKEIKPVMKLIIRGKKRQFLSAVGKSLNLLLPNEHNIMPLFQSWMEYTGEMFISFTVSRLVCH